MAEALDDKLDGLGELFERYNVNLFNFFLRLSHDHDLSHDLTQNVFFRLLKYRKSYKRGSRFKPWIYQMARNIYYDHYRKHVEKRDEFVNVSGLAEAWSDEEDLLKREQIHLLEKAMSLLSIEKREVLIMSRYQGMKYEEVAEVLDCTVSAVKVKVHRAMKELKELYFKQV
nr:RNA polymerase sigma factor [Xanthovirga aplysinae]